MPKVAKTKFRLQRGCEALTELTLKYLPRDGSLGRTRLYQKGSGIWYSQDLADSVYFLCRGQIRIVGDSTSGREVVFRQVKAGQLFGELCFCSGTKSFRMTRAVATADSEVLEIGLDHFLRYLQDNLSALASLACTFCKLLADSHRRIEVLACRGAEERLGRLLLQLAASRRTEDIQEHADIPLSLSHTDLADMAAMSRPHVTVTMGRFRRRGLVRYGRNTPLFVHMQRLKAHVKSEFSE